jgi:hypothetical protein
MIAIDLVQLAKLLAVLRYPVMLHVPKIGRVSFINHIKLDDIHRTCQKTKPLRTTFWTTSSAHVSRLSMWLANTISSWMLTKSHFPSLLANARACHKRIQFTGILLALDESGGLIERWETHLRVCALEHEINGRYKKTAEIACPVRFVRLAT